jgi:hypothetical protein
LDIGDFSPWIFLMFNHGQNAAPSPDACRAGLSGKEGAGNKKGPDFSGPLKRDFMADQRE